MRITQSIIYRNTIARVFENRDELNAIQNRIATQKRVQKASDDPISFSRISRFRTAYEQNEQFLKNINDANSWTSTTSLALDQLHEYAIQAKSLIAQGSDGTASTDLRESIAQSLQGILEESVSLSNTQYLGKSVFAGTNTENEKPFVLTGLTVTYEGNTDHIYRKISSNVKMAINVDGQSIMDTRFFEVLESAITALRANDTTAINSAMQLMESAEDEILNLSTSVASKMNSIDLVENRLNNTNLDLAKYISEEEDVVLEEEVVRFKAEQLAYEAALQSASEVMKLNIMKFIG